MLVLRRRAARGVRYTADAEGAEEATEAEAEAAIEAAGKGKGQGGEA